MYVFSFKTPEPLNYIYPFRVFKFLRPTDLFDSLLSAQKNTKILIEMQFFLRDLAYLHHMWDYF